MPRGGFDFILTFLFKAVFSVNTDNIQQEIKNEVLCDTSYLNIDILRNALSNTEIRKELFNRGIKNADDFLENL